MDEIISLCVQYGLYFIVDWHILEGEELHQEEAIGFFKYFSEKYIDTPNIIFELANEPWSYTASQAKEYVQKTSSEILKNIPNALIICGRFKDGTDATRNMMKEIQLDAFVSDHAYTASRDPLESIRLEWNANKPRFDTEWGNSEATGDGGTNDTRAIETLNFFHQHGMSQGVWKFTDQPMTTSFLRYRGKINSSYYAKGGFVESDLSHNGKIFLDYFKKCAFENHIDLFNYQNPVSDDFRATGVGIFLDNTKNYAFIKGNRGNGTRGFINIPIKKNTYYKLAHEKTNRFSAIIHTEKVDMVTDSQYGIKPVALDISDENYVTFYSGEATYLTCYLSVDDNYLPCASLSEISSDENDREKKYTQLSTKPRKTLEMYRVTGIQIVPSSNGKGSLSDTKNLANRGYLNVPVSNGTKYSLVTDGRNNRFRVVFSTSPMTYGGSYTMLYDNSNSTKFTFEPKESGYISVHSAIDMAGGFVDIIS